MENIQRLCSRHGVMPWRICALFLLLFAMSFSSAYAQKKALKWSDITSSPEQYVFGFGEGSSYDQALTRAQEAMVLTISSNVRSEFSSVMKHLEQNGQSNDEQTWESIMKSYSNMAGLRNVKAIVVSDKGGKYQVGCYLTMQDLKDIFERRKEEACNHVVTAYNASLSNELGTALQNYFWALALTSSYPEGNEVKIQDPTMHMVNLMTWVPQEMSRVCKDITVKVAEQTTDEDGLNLVLDVRFREQPVANLYLRAIIKGQAPEMLSVCDGRCELTVPADTKLKDLQIEIDYKGKITPLDNVLKEAVDLVSELKIENTLKKLDAKHIVKNPQTQYAVAAQPSMLPAATEPAVATNKVETYAENFLDKEQANPYIDVAKKIENILRQGNFSQLRNMATEEGWKMIDRLFNRKYGIAKLVGHPILQFLPSEDGVAIRSYPMSFKFNSNHFTTTENVVFHLDKQNKIARIAFALETAAEEDVLMQGEWTKETRQIIMDFLEAYKTSFAMEDISYTEQVFSDNALIIVGSKAMTRTGKGSEMQLKDQVKVKYTKLTKEQYIENLKRCFARNEYVNVKFGENQIKKGGWTNAVTGQHKDIYGIQIRQDYFSSTYGDTGYLFLAVDLENPHLPVIHIRTWQPYKDVCNDADNATYGEKIYGFEDFH